MNDTQEIYDRLRECFISSESNYTDKAKRFRSIYEEFARRENVDFDAPNITLAERLSQIFHVHGAGYQITEKSRNLLRKLNEVVHHDSPVSADELKDYYQALLIVIRAITHEEPDNLSLILSGLEEVWYAEGLNTEQKAAVVDDAQVINVNAGPGTGKTHLLVHKMLYYLKDDPKRNLVALTFTNTAATQLQERLMDVLAKVGRDSGEYSNCKTATIHSYCYQCLAEYYKAIGRPFDYEILDDSDIPAVAEEIASLSGHPDAVDTITNILMNGGTGELAIVVEEYKRANHFIRVEDILRLFIEESKDEEFLRWLGKRIDCLLIDESQDLTSYIFRVIQVFLSVNPQLYLFFVGDPRQNIFGFNGGSYLHLQKFMEGKHASEHTLTLTYRCPQAVIDKVNCLHFSDCKNPKLTLLDESIQGKCYIVPCATKEAEGRIVADIVRKLNDNSQTCVMATGLWYLESTAKSLNDLGIPYVVKGGRRFLSRPIKIVNYCLRVVATYDEHSLNRLSHYINGFMATPLHELLKESYEKGQGLEGISLPDLLGKIRHSLEEGHCMDNDSIVLVEKYIDVASEYKSIPDLLFACSSGKNDKFSPFYEQDFKVPCTTTDNGSSVPLVLSTIHAAKGLEWENVILAGVADRVLPSWRCNELGISFEESQKRRDDEMRKYYVAVTRCQKNLFLTYSVTSTNQWGKVFQCELSRFVRDSLSIAQQEGLKKVYKYGEEL